MKNQVIEGYMPFKEFKTYYRIVGDQKEAPIILLHGGPGSSHNYFQVLDDLANEGHTLIMYDQLGCGNSYVENRPDLWNLDTWMEELESLISYLHLEHFHLLGQSWGGMLAISYAIEKKPKGLVSLILSSTLPSSKLWAHEQHRLIHLLPEKYQQAINEAELTNTFDSPLYIEANAYYMDLHCIDANTPYPHGRSGREAYITAWGPNEFHPDGTLKYFDYTDRLKEIEVPTFIISGTNDLCTPLVAKTMYDRIPNSEWELFDGARHMVFVDCNTEYKQSLSSWLKKISR